MSMITCVFFLLKDISVSLNTHSLANGETLLVGESFSEVPGLASGKIKLHFPKNFP